MNETARATSAIARWTSILLHPFVVLSVLALLAAWKLEPASLQRTAVGLLVAIAVVWAFVWQRVRSGRWGTVDASHHSERPALYACVLLVMLLYWLWLGGFASAAAQGVVAVIAMLCVAGIANRWIKLSLHTACLVFSGILLLALWPYAGIFVLMLSPLLAWSRLRLRRHSVPEVMDGALLGLVAGIVMRVLG